MGWERWSEWVLNRSLSVLCYSWSLSVMLQSKEKDEIDFTMHADISIKDSKAQTVRLTEMLRVGWSLPQILLIRACHTYTLLAPYAKGLLFTSESQTLFAIFRASCHIYSCLHSLWWIQHQKDQSASVSFSHAWHQKWKSLPWAITFFYVELFILFYRDDWK